MNETINDLKKELNRILTDIGIYYQLRGYTPEELKRYLLDNYNIYLHILPANSDRFSDELKAGEIGWTYDVLNLNDNINCVSQDLRVFKTYDMVLYNALTEGFAFVSLYRLY